MPENRTASEANVIQALYSKALFLIMVIMVFLRRQKKKNPFNVMVFHDPQKSRRQCIRSTFKEYPINDLSPVCGQFVNLSVESYIAKVATISHCSPQPLFTAGRAS